MYVSVVHPYVFRVYLYDSFNILYALFLFMYRVKHIDSIYFYGDIYVSLVHPYVLYLLIYDLCINLYVLFVHIHRIKNIYILYVFIAISMFL